MSSETNYAVYEVWNETGNRGEGFGEKWSWKKEWVTWQATLIKPRFHALMRNTVWEV